MCCTGRRRFTQTVLVLSVCVAPVHDAAAQGCPGSWGPLGTGTNSSVYALTTLPDGDLIAGGFFSTAGGTNAARIARWSGGAWTPLGAGMPTPGGYVRALLPLPSGDLIAGGSFDTAGAASANSIARWDGVAWSALQTGVDNPVHAIAAVSGTDFAAGGSFTTAGGLSAVHAARWSAGPTPWSPLGLGTDSTVTCLARLTNGDLIVGGVFLSAGGGIGGIPAGGVPGTNNIARFGVQSGSWGTVGTGMNNPVWALATLPNGDVVAGGEFSTAGGVSASHIARWNGTSWNPMGSGINGTVYALAPLANGDVIAGGEFSLAGGVASACIARWNASTTTWVGLGTGMNATVRAVAVLPGGDIVAGGDFSTAGGTVCFAIARWSQPMAPTVLTQPENASTCASGSPNFSISASGTGSITYQWQIQSSPGVWQNLGVNPIALPCGGIASAANPTASQTTIAITPCAGLVTYQVRCIASNACGTATSDPAIDIVCYANCDCSTTAPVLTANDFQCFLNAFASGSGLANCDGSTTVPALTANDFQCFLNTYASGCP